MLMLDHEFRPFALAGYGLKLEREKQFDLKRTVIDVKLNFEEKAVEGKVELDLKMNSLAQDHLLIDATDMEVYNVSVKGVPASFDSYPDEIIVYGNFRPFTDYIITITYKAFPRRGGYFVEDEGGSQFWTQGEDTLNHAWFPCFDYPNTRSSYEIRVTVPRDYTVISNGTLINRIDGEFSTFVYREEFRFPAYLVSIIAGKFKQMKQEWQGIPITSYFLPKYSDLAERSFKNSPDMMDFISQKTGIRYPYAKYDQTCVTEFVFGGMENLSATTLTDRTLHDQIAHLDYQSESLICHEMAHQWFGDYVTCKDWSQAWLNEGFATFVALNYTEKLKGKEESLVAVEKAREAYMKEFKEGYGRPILERRYEDPIELFDRHLYQKASLFLRYLNYYLGEKVFWDGVRDYLDTNKMSAVSTEDFRKSLSRVSGYSLEQLFHQFLDEPGHPELKIEQSVVRGSVEINISQIGKKYVLRIPVRVYYEGRKEDFDVELTEGLTHITLERKGLKGWSLDPDSRVLCTDEIKRPRDVSRFIAASGESVIERAKAALELVKYGSSEVPFLLKCFEREKFWYVRGKIAEAVSKIGGEPGIKALTEMLEAKDYETRREVVTAVSNVRDLGLLSKLEKMMDKEEGYLIRANIISSAQKTGKEKAKNILLRGLKTDSYDQWIRVAALHALGDLSDPSTLSTIKDHLEKKFDWRIRQAAMTAVYKFYWKDRSVGEILLNGLKDDYFAVRMSAAEGIKNIGDATLIDRMSSFVADEPDGRARRKMREAMETKANEAPREVESLRNDVEKLKERVTKLEARKISRN